MTDPCRVLESLLSGPRSHWALFSLVLAVYFLLAATTASGVGVVGEVAIGWGLGKPPKVLVSLEPPRSADGAVEAGDGHRWGPLVSSRVRPLERLSVGQVDLPVAINRYTGGLVDWPARALFAVTQSIKAVVALHVALGGLLLALVWRFARGQGGRAVAAASGLVLATDWSFVFYRKVLGGTELGLLFATVLCLMGIWSRRWTGSRRGLLLLGLGVGLGLHAKLTFAVTLAALGLTTVLMRWDRGPMRPPLPQRAGGALALCALLVSPLVVAAAHGWLAPTPLVPLQTHDFGGQQWARVLNALQGGATPAREGLGNLWVWASHPLEFFHIAYGATPQPVSALRVAGWGGVFAGLALPWWRRHAAPRDALARFVSVLLPLQVGGLFLVARDLHHLATAAPIVALAAGLAADQLAGLVAPPRSMRRLAAVAVVSACWALPGIRDLARTDPMVEQIRVPTFTRSGQAELVELLRAGGVSEVVVADYESYGMFELVAPDIAVEHVWPAVSVLRADALPVVLRHTQGRHLLLVEASAPMVYNLRADTRRLQEAAEQAGVSVEVVGRLSEGRATLVQVGRAP